MNYKEKKKGITQNYCPNCGQPTARERIDKNYIIREIAQVFSFEKGLPYTIRELLIRPGQTVRGFLTESPTKIVKPITFITFTSLIFVLCNHFFHFQDDTITFLESKKLR